MVRTTRYEPSYTGGCECLYFGYAANDVWTYFIGFLYGKRRVIYYTRRSLYVRIILYAAVLVSNLSNEMPERNYFLSNLTVIYLRFIENIIYTSTYAIQINFSPDKF